jgi:hypothetical protein
MHAGTRLLFVLLVGQRVNPLSQFLSGDLQHLDEPCALLALSQSCVSDSCNKQLACEECIASSGSGEHCLRSVELCSASACWLQCQFPVYDDCVHKRKMATAAPRPLAPSLAQADTPEQLFEEYVRMHRAASSEPITSERTYIIWHAGPQGFGNRLRGLLGFVLLSLALNKVLYIAWEEPVHFSELLKPKADFDAAQHLDRLTSHFGKADTFCIPCGTDLVDHGCKPGLEPVTILTEALWQGNYVQVVPSKHMRRDAYTHARTHAQTSAHARRHACARTHARMPPVALIGCGRT